VPTLDEITVEGAPTPAAPPQAPALIRPEPGYVAVTRPGGEVKAVPESDLEAAIASGDRPATSAEFTNKRMGAFGPIASGLAEGVRTATFGLSDAALVEGDRLIEGDAEAERMRQALREMKEVNPGANLAGMIGGSLAPLMFGSPSGVVATGESLLARAGARALQAAPRALLEGAAIGAGQQLTEDVLGNHELVAQKYLAAGLKGGIIGVLAAGTMSAGLGAIGDKLALRSERAAVKAAESGVYRTAGELSESLTGKPLMGRATEFAEKQAAKSVLPASSISASELSKLGATAEQQEARFNSIGRTLLDRGHVTPTASKAAMASTIAADVKVVGAELGATRKMLEQSAVRPSIENVARGVNAILDDLKATPFSGHLQQAVAPIVSELTERMGGKLAPDGSTVLFERSTFKTFDELFQLRKALDPHLKWERGLPPSNPAVEQLRAIRRVLEEEFEGAAERAASDLGENVAAKYRVQKATYANLKTAEKWVTKAVGKQTQNNAIGINTMNLIGHAGQAALSGHPLALVAPLANHIRDRYGNQIAASLVDRATKIQSLQAAAAKFDQKLSASVAAFFGGGKALPAKKLDRVSPETARALREAVRNPAALTEKVSDALATTGLKDHAPRVSQAAATTIMRAANYVRSSMPAEPKPQGVAFGIQKPRPLGLKEQMRLDHAVHALDAEAVLDDIARGQIDRQRIEAIRIINPPLFAAIQSEIRNYGIQNQPEITTQREVALRIIFGTPVSTLTAPTTVRGFQKAFDESAAPQPQPPGRPMNPARPTGHATSFDRMERGE
jgi:hypothetical protein